MARGARYAWLSITPEPERDLPSALGTLRAGGPPSAEAVAEERARAARLVTRGRRRAWRAYLREARALAERAACDGEGREARELAERDANDGPVREARAVVLEVLDNHDNLTLGLPRRHGGPP